MEYVLASICQPGDNSAVVFEADDTRNWEQETLNSFVADGVLKQYKPAVTVTCRGCDRLCRRPVVRLTAINGKPARRFITCPYFDQVATMNIQEQRVRRWRSSIYRLAVYVSDALGLPKPKPSRTKGEVHVGQIRGPNGRRKVKLVNNGKLVLQVGEGSVALSDVMFLDDNALHIRTEEIWAIADEERSGATEKSYEPCKTKQKENKSATETRDHNILREARWLKRVNPDWNRKRIIAEIAKQPFAQRTSGERKHLSVGRIEPILSGKS